MSLVDKLNRTVKVGLASSLIALSGLGISGCNTSAGMYGSSVGYRVGAQNAAASGNIRQAQALGVLGDIAEFMARGEQQKEAAEAGRSEINQNVYVGPPLQGVAVTRTPLQGRAVTIHDRNGGVFDLIYKKHNITTYDFKDENGKYPVFISNDFVDRNKNSNCDFPEELINFGKTKFSTNEKVRLQLFKALTREQVVLKTIVKNITLNEVVEETEYSTLPYGYDTGTFYDPGELKPGIHHYKVLDNNNKIIGEAFFEVYKKEGK